MSGVNVLHIIWGFPGGAMVKNLPTNAGDARDMGSVPGLGRSPGLGNGNPLQYSCLENSMDRGVHGITRVGHDLETKPPLPCLGLWSSLLARVHQPGQMFTEHVCRTLAWVLAESAPSPSQG